MLLTSVVWGQGQSAAYEECSRNLSARTGWPAIEAACSGVPEITSGKATYRILEAIQSWAANAKDEEKAAQWALAAAAKGSSRSAFWLGARYYLQRAEAAPQAALAVRYLNLALDNTEGPLGATERQFAILTLAELYDNKVLKNRRLALEQWERLLLEPELAQRTRKHAASRAWSLSTIVLPSAAAANLARAAEAGDPLAQAHLALELNEPLTSPSNDAVRRRLLKEAFESGEYIAGPQLAGLMLAGRGGGVDGPGAEQVLLGVLKASAPDDTEPESETGYPGFLSDRVRVLLKRAYEQGALGNRSAAQAADLDLAEQRFMAYSPQSTKDPQIDAMPAIFRRFHSLSIHEPSAAEYESVYTSARVTQNSFVIEAAPGGKRTFDVSVLVPQQGLWTATDVDEAFRRASEILGECGIAIRRIFVSRVHAPPELLRPDFDKQDWVTRTRLPRTPLIRVALVDSIKSKTGVDGQAMFRGPRISAIVSYMSTSALDALTTAGSSASTSEIEIAARRYEARSVALRARHRRAYVVAHELGHILGQMGHDFSVVPNLMNDFGGFFGYGPPTPYTCQRMRQSPMLNDADHADTELLAPAFARPLNLTSDARAALLAPLDEDVSGFDKGKAVATAFKTLGRGTARKLSSTKWRLLSLAELIDEHVGSITGKPGDYGYDFIRGVRTVLTDAELIAAVDDSAQSKLLLEALSSEPDDFTGMVLNGKVNSTVKSLKRLFASDVTPLLPTLKRWVLFSSMGFPMAEHLARYYVARKDDERAAFYIVIDQRTKLRGEDSVPFNMLEELDAELDSRLLALPDRANAIKGLRRFDSWGVGNPMP